MLNTVAALLQSLQKGIVSGLSLFLLQVTCRIQLFDQSLDHELQLDFLLVFLLLAAFDKTSDVLDLSACIFSHFPKQVDMPFLFLLEIGLRITNNILELLDNLPGLLELGSIGILELLSKIPHTIG